MTSLSKSSVFRYISYIVTWWLVLKSDTFFRFFWESLLGLPDSKLTKQVGRLPRSEAALCNCVASEASRCHCMPSRAKWLISTSLPHCSSSETYGYETISSNIPHFCCVRNYSKAAKMCPLISLYLFTLIIVQRISVKCKIEVF